MCGLPVVLIRAVVAVVVAVVVRRARSESGHAHANNGLQMYIR